MTEPVIGGLRMALDFVLPPRCASCGERVVSSGRLCGACWPGLTFVGRPFCMRCGRPFEFDIPGNSQCAACLRRPPSYDRAFSPLVYGEMSRKLVLQLKHADRLSAAPLLAMLMQPHVAGFGYSAPLLVPVPLHPFRLIQRRFNQSALLAKEIARVTEGDVDLLSLRRMRATPMQKGLSARERRDNVRAAFAVAPKRRGRIKGRDVILIDDVLTTGATAEACAKALRKAGAKRIGVLTAARVAGPQTAAL